MHDQTELDPPGAPSNGSPEKGAVRSRRLSAVMVWTVAFLLLGEASVRVRAWVRRGETGTQQAIYQTDAQLGRVVKPGSTSRNGTARTTINRWGLRGPDFELEKCPDMTRILCLGASTTFGQPADDDDEIWVSQLASRLNDSAGRQRFEVLNGAVPGYTVEQSLAHFRRALARFKPDIVIVCHAATDLAAHTRRQFAPQGGGGVAQFGMPSFARHVEGTSLAYELIRANTASLRAGQFRRNRNRRVDERGVERFQGVLTQLINECQVQQAEVIVCTFARAFSIDQPLATRARMAATASYFNPQLSIDGLIDAYDRYNEAIRKASRSASAHLADAAEIIPHDASSFRDSVHFSTLGHQQMADLLADEIAELRAQSLTQVKVDPLDAIQ